MAATSPATGYARLTPWQARGVLLALAGLTGFCLAAVPAPPPVCNLRQDGSQTGDVALYRAEINRIHAGEGYYQAAAKELVARDYPTRSVFNWRTPLPMWLLGKMPAVVLGQVLLGGLALAVLLLAFEAASREQPNIYRLAAPLVVLLIGALLPCLLGDLYVMPVLWAGTLIALSICAYGLNLPALGVASGLAAVFFRELALPYAVLAAGLAWHQRRRRELLSWLAGLAAWAVFFGLHCWQAGRVITPDALPHRHGWICFGGAPFVLATVQANACLLLVPTWVTVLYFVAAMVGLGGWDTPMGRRAAMTLCLFVAAFSVVGQDFNRYWGIMIAPLLCFGAVRAPAALWHLCRAAEIPWPGWHARSGSATGA
jgi:hypothetical protein